MKWLTFLQDSGLLVLVAGASAWLARELVKHYLKHDIAGFIGEMAREYAGQLQESKNRFTVGVTSHMADVAFDKHVQFCEEYTKALNGAMETLFKRGPHEDALQEADKLMDVRLKWTVWLTPEVQAALIKFEGALRKIGANAWLLKELRADEDRTEAVKEAFGTFAAIMGWEKWKGEVVTRDVASEKIIEGLQDVIGVTELTKLRAALVKRAMVERL